MLGFWRSIDRLKPSPPYFFLVLGLGRRRSVGGFCAYCYSSLFHCVYLRGWVCLKCTCLACRGCIEALVIAELEKKFRKKTKRRLEKRRGKEGVRGSQ